MGQQGTLSYIWSPRGSRPVQGRDCRHQNAYLFGAICPARAVGTALVMPQVSSEAMTRHLAEISKAVGEAACAVLVCDGAGWYRPGGHLHVPERRWAAPPAGGRAAQLGPWHARSRATGPAHPVQSG